MGTKINISLRIPNATRPDRYFSFRLQQQLHNEPSIYGRSPKIFVVSGIENDFQAFCRLLRKHGIIDKYLKWHFNEGHLVVLGNCLDKEEQDTECLWFIYALEERARKAGGHVHFILGNHEVANMNGNWRYFHPKYASATLDSPKPLTALYGGNHELWRWLRTKNIIEKIGSILFVPAGISGELLAQSIAINDINNYARLHYTQSLVSSGNSLFQLLLDSDQSPLLYQGYYRGGATEAQIVATLTQFRVKTIITGITTGEPIHTDYHGKVININPIYTADSSAGLLIKRGKFYIADSKGGKEEIK